MHSKRWLRIIPVALIMYTISYIDRTNVSLAMEPKISHMLSDLKMDNAMKGQAGGIFFFGYVLLQIPGGYLASRWSAKKLTAILLVVWGACAVGCGFVTTFRQFEVMRFLLGVAESGVYPATLVLLAHWFPRSERARANAFWQLCMPLSVAFSSPLTGWMLPALGWHKTLALEGILPFLWLPIWLYFISDHPREARWLSADELNFLEAKLQQEAAAKEVVKTDSISHAPRPGKILEYQAVKEEVKSDSIWRAFLRPSVLVMLIIYFLQNSAVYGCMTFLTDGLKGSGFEPTGFKYGVLFAVPYLVTAVVMVVVSWRSDKSGERRGYLFLVYFVSGVCLIGSVLVKQYSWAGEHSFWFAYGLLCLAVPGPFAALAPFWAIPAETLPRSVMGSVMGLVNAIGNLGGFFGPAMVGAMTPPSGNVTVPFSILGAGLVVAAALVFLLPGVPLPARDELKAATAA